jgi:hypothetical protein
MVGIYDDVTRLCMCGDSLGEHWESAHDIGTRAGVRVRTKCLHVACGCRMFRPKAPRDDIDDKEGAGI